MLSANVLLVLLSAIGLATAAPTYKRDEVNHDLKKIKNVVIFMQENRAFDHYFGSLAGVRGFQDPNVQYNDAKPVFYYPVNSSLTNASDYLLPFHLSYQGETNRSEAVQCAFAGSNGYAENTVAYDDGKADLWALGNAPLSVAYHRREDIPVHFTIADEFSVGDMYQESIIASTDPNRVMLWSGSINGPNNNRFNSSAGPVLDNNRSPGCISLNYKNDWVNLTSSKNITCYPFDWKTVPEYLEDAGFSWYTYQARENFCDNPLIHFSQYKALAAEDVENPLVARGLLYQPTTDAAEDVILTNWYNASDPWTGGMEAFKKDAAAGTLPRVSYVVLPSELTEHEPFLPNDGGWAIREIVDAFMKSPQYPESAMLLSYDETGGWSDHVTPFVAPPGTPGERMWNPFMGKDQPLGPGFRLPFFVISPWTRDGVVFTEPADHTSQIMFLEEWAKAHGSPFFSNEISDWRRAHMSNLVDIFDFSTFNASYVDLPKTNAPHTTNGYLDSSQFCEETYGNLTTPTLPYGKQNVKNALWVESGFRPVRGQITEGRHLVAERKGRALAYSNSYALSSEEAVEKKHAYHSQRFVIHNQKKSDATHHVFKISFASAPTGKQYIGTNLKLTSAADAGTFKITYHGYGSGYYIQSTSTGQYVVPTETGVAYSDYAEGFKFYAVTFDTETPAGPV